MPFSSLSSLSLLLLPSSTIVTNGKNIIRIGYCIELAFVGAVEIMVSKFFGFVRLKEQYQSGGIILFG